MATKENINFGNKKLAVFGFTFKANTNDTRQSPTIDISKYLFQEGAKLAFYDPKVNESQIISAFKDYENEGTFEICKTPLEACINSDAVIVLTEWNEFKFLEWQEIYDVMQKPAWVFDARICLEKDNLKKIGFKVWSLGTSF